VSIASFLYIKLTIIDSEASAESSAESSESPPSESPPAEYSDWDGFSDTLSFDSASDAFTDNYTDSEAEGIDTSWLFSTVEEHEDVARKRYIRRRNRHIQERDQRRLDRQLKEVDWSQLDDNPFDIWATELRQDQDNGLDQDNGPQKRQHSSMLDSTDLERRYPSRKRQLTTKAADNLLYSRSSSRR
jgi:hypothetical protein